MKDTAMVRYLQLSLSGMFVAVGLPLMSVAGLGAYPTWQFAGWAGLKAEGFALALAGFVFWGAAAVVFQLFGKQGRPKVGYGFVILGPIRILGIAGLAVATWAIGRPPVLVFAGWAIGFYLVALVSESVWLAKALAHASSSPATPPGDEMKKD